MAGRTLATARGPCPQKATLKEQGINPNKLLSSSRVKPRRMAAKSEPARPRCRQTTEKIFQFALGEVHASDKSFQTESVSQPPKEEKAEAHSQVKQEKVKQEKVKQEAVGKKGAADKETTTKKTVEKETAKKPIPRRSIARKSIVKKKVVKREEKS